MQLEQTTPDTDWNGSVPTALDGRVLALILALAALAASMNVPYGGIPTAVAAFAILACGGVAGHYVGECRLRAITDGLVERWVDAGGEVDDVTRTAAGLRTEWLVHTPDGEVTVGGFAMAPMSKLSLEWRGMGEVVSAADAEGRLDSLAEEWYGEIFEIR